MRLRLVTDGRPDPTCLRSLEDGGYLCGSGCGFDDDDEIENFCQAQRVGQSQVSLCGRLGLLSVLLLALGQPDCCPVVPAQTDSDSMVAGGLLDVDFRHGDLCSSVGLRGLLGIRK